MNIKLIAFSLISSTFLLNGCIDRSPQIVQPEVPPEMQFYTPIHEPIFLTQDEIDKIKGIPVKDWPKNVEQPLPYYPVKALSEGIEGQLTVKFDVDENGQVQNIRMLASPLVDVFGLSVIRALEQWRYEEGKPTKDLSAILDFKSRSKK